MNLLQVRTQFVKQTGRYDLVVDATSYLNNGADFYIQAGQRYLDRHFEFPKAEGEFTLTLATSAISSTLNSRVRTVLEIAVVDTGDDTIKYLKKRSMREMREYYGDEVESLSNVTAAEPTSWSLAWLRGTTIGTTTTQAVNESASYKLITMPPADKTYTLKVRGNINAPTLSNDTSQSYWSIEHPDILIQAAMYKLEVSYRNFEGARAMKEALDLALIELDNDAVEQAIVEEDTLKDSHRFILDPIRNQDRYQA